MNRLTVAANARISSSMRFSLINNSSTPPFTASTNRSDTRTAFLTASFFAFSVWSRRRRVDCWCSNISWAREVSRLLGSAASDFAISDTVDTLPRPNGTCTGYIRARERNRATLNLSFG
uniref:Uncharacterized protein n=1 Tax=Rhizophora mucronata TaxID=61149 RepID=A0A2P2K646_RHIMU